MPLIQVLERARDLGFLGPGPVSDHITHAEQLLDPIEIRFGPDPEFWAVDLGSGGGLPGLVLASRYPNTRWCLLDANLRRTDFLSWAVDELGFATRVSVLRERAEIAPTRDEFREAFDLATARSFAAPAITAESAVPLLRPEGYLMVSEPPEPQPDRWPAEGLAGLGLVLDELGSWVVLRRTGPVPPRLPRREGAAAKRPAW